MEGCCGGKLCYSPLLKIPLANRIVRITTRVMVIIIVWLIPRMRREVSPAV